MNTNVQPKVLVDLAQVAAENEALRARIAELEAAKSGRSLSFKVAKTGAVSVYGLQRFPVTLYGSQWEKLAKAMPSLEAFLKANAASLATKG